MFPFQFLSNFYFVGVSCWPCDATGGIHIEIATERGVPLTETSQYPAATSVLRHVQKQRMHKVIWASLALGLLVEEDESIGKLFVHCMYKKGVPIVLQNARKFLQTAVSMLIVHTNCLWDMAAPKECRYLYIFHTSSIFTINPKRNLNKTVVNMRYTYRPMCTSDLENGKWIPQQVVTSSVSTAIKSYIW